MAKKKVPAPKQVADEQVDNEFLAALDEGSSGSVQEDACVTLLSVTALDAAVQRAMYAAAAQAEQLSPKNFEPAGCRRVLKLHLRGPAE
jgi:hypothetical protein